MQPSSPITEDTPTDPLTDAQHLYRLHHQIEETGLIFEEEVNAFCAVYFKSVRKHSMSDHAAMNGVLDQAVDRFKSWMKRTARETKALLVVSAGFITFMSQVIPYQDFDLKSSTPTCAFAHQTAAP